MTMVERLDGARDAEVEARAGVLFEEHQRRVWIRTDRLFMRLLLLQWIGAIVLALWLSPTSWSGDVPSVHSHVITALLFGGLVIAYPLFLAWQRPGETLTRHVVAIAQMILSALLIHVTGGRIETHFHVFGSLAFLAFYRDWKVLMTATVVVAADHLLRGFYWPQSVYGVAFGAEWRWLEHSAWVVFEDVFLIHSCRQGVREMQVIARRQAAVESLNKVFESRVEERTAQLQESEERFRSLCACSPVGIFQLDPSGRCTYSNGRLNAGHPLECSADRSRLQSDWDAAIERQSAHSVEFEASLDGAHRWLSCEWNPTRDASGGLTGFVGVLEDITDRKLAERSMAAARRAAEEANRAKSEFLATMSHELRTPLNAIIGFSEMLADQTFGPLNPKQTRYVNNVMVSGRHLLQLINDILDLAKVEAGRMELDRSEFDIRAALANTRAIVTAIASRKRIEVSLETEDATPRRISGDEPKLKQIMYNLLSNSIKFTPDGGSVKVTVRPVHLSLPADVKAPAAGWHPRNGPVLLVSVADSGIGIDPQDQERVFGEFEQINSGYAREQQGTGLGLALTRKLVELHGGVIWVDSTPGEGSVFHFTLPLVAEQTVSQVLEKLAPPETRGSDPLLVLVVEDDPAAREILGGHLTRAGYVVAYNDNGQKLTQLAARIKPFAITLDVRLGDVDGYTLLSELKASSETQEIPVIIVSMTDDRQVGLALGATAFIPKPVDPQLLYSVLRQIQDGRPGMTVLVVDDEPAAVEMVSDMLSTRGYEVLAATDGLQAILLAASRRPHAIVLDLAMPALSGFEVVRILRSNPDTVEIPIVIFTGCDLSQAERARLRDVNAIASKTGKDEIVEKLERIRRNSVGVEAGG